MHQDFIQGFRDACFMEVVRKQTSSEPACPLMNRDGEALRFDHVLKRMRGLAVSCQKSAAESIHRTHGLHSLNPTGQGALGVVPTSLSPHRAEAKRRRSGSSSRTVNANVSAIAWKCSQKEVQNAQFVEPILHVTPSKIESHTFSPIRAILPVKQAHPRCGSLPRIQYL